MSVSYTKFTKNEKCSVQWCCGMEKRKMTKCKKRILTVAIIALSGFVLGRLAVRGGMNLLMGGTLLGGNLL